MENSKKPCGWSTGVRAESRASREAERPLFHKGPVGLAKRSEGPGKELCQLKDMARCIFKGHNTSGNTEVERKQEDQMRYFLIG